ncbi:MAG: hypothetical protein J6C97_04590, partial [Clostridia bacterium]|nr:hypothetical protein [Clostridia bacterium]
WENIIDLEDVGETTIYARDLSYFFGNDQDIIDAYGETVIYTDTIDRQFTAQYPDYEVVNRCAIMKHLPTNQLEDLNEMWASVKIGYMKPIYMVLIVFGFIVLFALAVVFFKLIESGKFGYGKTRKNLKLVKKEEIKD